MRRGILLGIKRFALRESEPCFDRRADLEFSGTFKEGAEAAVGGGNLSMVPPLEKGEQESVRMSDPC
jgi:hypothetical protein